MASIVGLAALIHTGALVFQAVKTAGFVYLFYLAFLPQFIDPHALAHDLLFLGLVFMAMTLAVFVVYGLFASLVGEKVLNSDCGMTWMRRTVAVTFAGIGLRLAWRSDNLTGG